MRRIIYALLLFVFLLCVFPVAAFANPAVPIIYTHELLIDDCSNIESLTIYGFDEDDTKHEAFYFHSMNEFVYIEYEWIKKTDKPSERIIGFANDVKHYKSFQLEIKFYDEERQQSKKINFIDNANYHYNVEKNVLRRSFLGFKEYFHYKLPFWLIALFSACSFAILIEWLVALLFKIKPLKHVVFTNLVTNPAMNIILLAALWKLRVSYYWMVFFLELIVIGLEYFYYKFKYKDVGKWRLLIFSITANAVSWGAYALIGKIP